MIVHEALLVRNSYMLLRVRIWFNNHCNLGGWIYNMHVQSCNTLVLYSIENSKHFIFNPVFFFYFLVGRMGPGRYSDDFVHSPQRYYPKF